MNPEPDHSVTTADLANVDRPDTRTTGGRSTPTSSPATTGNAKADPRPSGPPDAAPQSALFAEHEATDLRKRWSDVQVGFVDEPRRAVQQADTLVADVMKRLAAGFATERAALEKQWDQGDAVTTEDLRVALQRYRSFFDRLLAF